MPKSTSVQPLEKEISKSIIAAIKREYPGSAIRKRHVSMGTMGDPDIYGCLLYKQFDHFMKEWDIANRHIEIEVKRPGNEPTELQWQRLAEWKAAGAIAGVAHSVAEALEIIREQL